MRREEELARHALFKRDGLERLRVVKAGGHRLEGPAAPAEVPEDAVHGARRIEPVLAGRAVRRRYPGVVRLLGDVYANEPVVVQEQFGDQLEPRVAEVAVPGVAVLVPDLDDLHVQVFGREDLAVGRFEGGERELRPAEVAQRVDEEGAGFVLVARRDDAHRSSRDAVLRVDVGQPLQWTHGRDVVVDEARRMGDVLEVGRDTFVKGFVRLRPGAHRDLRAGGNGDCGRNDNC